MSDNEIEWPDCPDVERVPGRVSGRWVVKDSRILADGIIESFATAPPSRSPPAGTVTISKDGVRTRACPDQLSPAAAFSGIDGSSTREGANAESIVSPAQFEWGMT